MSYKVITSLLFTALLSLQAGADLKEEVTHGYADNQGVRIHYTTTGPTNGEAPLVVMIHGFPDFWYSWRHQMNALKSDFQVVAIDQRGYNKSDAPEGVENYAMNHLVEDVAAVIRHLGQEKAIVVGHDWGGAVAWNFAFSKPHMLDKLVVLNLPHPIGMNRSRMQNADAAAGTNYTVAFRTLTPDHPEVFFGGPMTAQTISGWVTDKAAVPRYIEAFERSDFQAMLNYYKANYPPPPAPDAPPPPAPPKVDAPVLMFHGLQDTALHSDGLNNTWDWVSKDLTIVTTPDAAHFVQQDAAELVSTTMKWWLLSRP